MMTYAAPLDDIRFALYELNDFEGDTAALPGHEEVSRDLVEAVLDEAAKFCVNELLPLNQPGDDEGCHYENGVVRTPKGFPEAYRAFAEGGWTGVSCHPEHSGQGLPNTLQFVLNEMVSATNMAFGMYPGLSRGAYDAIDRHGNAEQQATYLPKLASGEWAGTMCLTEPQCGTDLGLIRSKAEPAGDGSWQITGTKIFISAGEHDLTENIVHLVLARLPDAPPGIKGISLFVVPKILVAPDGSLGTRNGVRCGSIEHKMGIKASATCVMNFDGALGELIGEPHGGMRAMFTMMNAARLGVGIQGLGLAEAAYQTGAAYARDRRQGRSVAGVDAPDQPADAIIVHPDVRRNLLSMKAVNEAARALVVRTAMALDRAERHGDPAERAAADDLVALLTPVIKSFCTDHGFTAANHALQVFGGHGYIKEWGIEQTVRDARITQLYEGTNGIQALDLVGRKLGLHNGRLLRRFFHPLTEKLNGWGDDPQMAEIAAVLGKAAGRLQQATAVIASRGLGDPEQAAAAASDYLRLFALVALGQIWAETAALCQARAAEGSGFHAAKLATAKFYFAWVLPESGTLFARVMAGKDPLMALPEDAF